MMIEIKPWTLCAVSLVAYMFIANTYALNLSMESVLGNVDRQSDSDTGSEFKRVLQPREFQFPEDHLSHPEYKTEWWYFSGNIHAADSSSGAQSSSQRFGYQFTLFRFALRSGNVKHSKWQSQNIYMAHIALTDIQQNKYYHQERFSRDGAGLAGARQNQDGRLQFWLNNWKTQSNNDSLFPLTLTVNSKQFSLELTLDSIKPVVLQGDMGFSQKSKQPGNASYYYSYTRLKTEGKIKVGAQQYLVKGLSWLDREWSSSSLGDEQQGWDWFSLQLNDGSELMLYQMRNKDGTKDAFSSGTLINAQGNREILEATDFELQAKKFWISPISGIRYPIQWQLQIPEQKLDVIISTPVKDQEWSKAGGDSFNYWEGAVELKGKRNMQPVTGLGYLEMTGYQ